MQTEITNNSPDGEEEANKSHFSGFVDIVYEPAAVGERKLAQAVPIIASGLLLYIVGALLSLYITYSSPELKQQIVDMNSKLIEFVENNLRQSDLSQEEIEDNIANVRDSFTEMLDSDRLPLTLLSTLFMGAAALFFFAAIFWIMARAMSETVPSYSVVAAFVGYGFAISAIGKILTAALQSAGDSLFFSPSLAMFLSMQPEPPSFYTYQFMLQVNIFPIWEQLAVGIAVARSANLSSKKGLVFGVIAYVILMALYSLGLLTNSVFSG